MNSQPEDESKQPDFSYSQPEESNATPKIEIPEIQPSEPEQKLGEPGKETREAEEMEIPQEEVEEIEEMGPSRGRRFLRWVLGILILMGIGFLAAILLFYVPMRDQANNLRVELNQSEQRIEALNQTIDQREQRIQDLQSLETRNQELEAELQQTNLHIAILQARNDVAAARLALNEDTVAQARIALSKTSDTLDSIASLLPANQRDVVTSMQQRLDLALSGIENDQYAASSDLDVLATNLTELENTLFTSR
jgi:TolA-binding protein